MSEWLTIGTAPRDGAWFLVCRTIPGTDFYRAWGVNDQRLEIFIAQSYKAGETLGTVTVKDCKLVHFECANCGRLTAELEALRADALRYRWLRENYASVGFGGRELLWDQPDQSGALDAAIDAARGAT